MLYIVYYIAEPPPASFVAYTPPQKPDVQLQRKRGADETPVEAVGAASNPAPPVLLATVSQVVTPIPISVAVDDMTDGMSIDLGMGEGFGVADLGDGLGGDGIGEGRLGDGGRGGRGGSGGGGMGTTTNDGSSLEGSFYDLKMHRDCTPTHLSEEGVVAALANFFVEWDENELEPFYRSETKLYASSWYLPAALARYGPIAFQVGDPKKPESQWECKPSAWLAIYRGRVVAPKTGTFRFLGTGDDCVAVRFNRELVLDAGFILPTRWSKQNPRAARVSHGGAHDFAQDIASGRDSLRKDYKFIKGIRGCEHWDNALGGVIGGAPFKVSKGQAYDIEIAITEIPGGQFGFVLFIEDITRRANNRGPKYDIFRTSKEIPKPQRVMKSLKDTGCYVTDNVIPFSVDSLIWEVAP